MVKYIKLMTDYGAHPLWWYGPTAEEMDEYNLDPATLPLSQEALVRLQAWADTYDSILNWDDPASSGFSSQAEKDAFEAEGIVLWQQLIPRSGKEL